MDLVYPCVQPTYRVLRARLVILHQAGNISYMALESNARGQNVSGASNGPYALPCTTDNQHTGYLGFCTSKVLIVQERKGYSLAYLHDQSVGCSYIKHIFEVCLLVLLLDLERKPAQVTCRSGGGFSAGGSHMALDPTWTLETIRHQPFVSVPPTPALSYLIHLHAICCFSLSQNKHFLHLIPRDTL